jgi:uncharacterized protein
VLERAARLSYLGLGVLCVGLGVIGAFLPVMPTTVFLLIAVWAFSKSSARLERWLLDHPRFGPRIRQWRAHRTIPWSVKLTAWGSMAGSLGIMFVADAGPIAMISAGVVIAIGAIYIASRPSRPPDGLETRTSEPDSTQ